MLLVAAEWIGAKEGDSDSLGYLSSPCSELRRKWRRALEGKKIEVIEMTPGVEVELGSVIK